MVAEITASIMCADLLNLERDIIDLEMAGVDYFHYDIMDGHFVPNMTLGIETICEIQKRVEVRSDFHLLVKRPEEIIPLLDAGEEDLIAFHFEGTKFVKECLKQIKKTGARAGIVLNPKIAYTELEPYLEYIDYVNLMMINPGFAGQPILEGMMEKIMETRKWLDALKQYETKIMVDGNVNFERARLMSGLGGDILVAGTSSLFSGEYTFAEAVAKLKEYTTRRGTF